MKTSTIPASAPVWHIIDAEGQSLGRMATTIAHVLRGKHKASFSPHQLCGDQVIVVNAGKLKFDPKKLMQKEYVSHSGYIGHMKSTSLREMLEKHPDRVLTKAVQGMLSKNRLRSQIMKRLHVYLEAEHKHEAQKPTPLSLS